MRAVLQEQVESVGLLLLNGRGELFLVEELHANSHYGKKRGDRSFPWETKKWGEGNTSALARLKLEEMDATGQLTITEPVFIGKVGVHGTLAHIYVACFISGPDNMRGADAGIEVEPLGWQNRSFLIERCRDGVREVLALFDSCADRLLEDEPERIRA